MIDMFIELEHGNYITLDLHGTSVEDARAQLLHAIDSADLTVNAILVVHGYNLGTKLKNFVRNDFLNDKVLQKINIDAGRTLLKLKR